jgi:hypothetical protein
MRSEPISASLGWSGFLRQGHAPEEEKIGGYVSIQDLLGVLLGMMEAVRQNVADMRARQAVQLRFNELIEGK